MKNLRELAKEYSQNVIDQDTYRQSRRELIEGICTGEIEVVEHEYMAPLESVPEKIDDTTENMITQIIAPEKKSSQSGSEQSPSKSESRSKSTPPRPDVSGGRFNQKNILIATGAIISVCIIILIALLLPNTEEPPVSNSSAVSVPGSSAGQKLIVNFMQQKDWSEGSLKSFATSWQQLASEEVSLASTSPEMKRLGNMIYLQLLDERALISLGDVKSAVVNQQRLVNFAHQVGINDERLTVFEPEPVIDTKTESKQTDVVENITTENKLIDADTISNPNMASAIETEKNLLSDKLESQADTSEETLKTAVALDKQLETTQTTLSEPEDTLDKALGMNTNSAQSTTKTAAQKKTNKAACKSSLVKSRKPFCRDRIEGVGSGPTMVVIRNGKFMMGGKNTSEQPTHMVTIGSHFAMSVNEISFGEYEQFCQSTKSTCPKQPWSGKDYPIVSITHNNAVSYTEWLTEKTGQLYRLPSEAEWEYSARAGTQSEYPFGDEILISNAVFSDKKKLSAPLPTSDRSINRNKFRLYHMVGNVREWVADNWYDGYSGAPDDGSARIDASQNQHVVRGGSYADTAQALRSAARDKLATSDNYTGFRVLQELSE